MPMQVMNLRRRNLTVVEGFTVIGFLEEQNKGTVQSCRMK